MKIIAHACGPTVHPHLTVASARLALEEGADIIELDVRLTKDGRVAVSHDADAMGLWGCPDKIAEMTSEKFLSLRHLGDPSYPTHLLDDFIKCGIAPLLLHVKVGTEDLPVILETLKQYDYLDRVIMGVGRPEAVKLVKEFDPGIPVLAFMGKPEDAGACMEAGAEYIRLWEIWITEQRVRHVLDAGRRVWIMARNPQTGYTTPENLILWETMGIDGVLINDVPMAHLALATSY